MRLRETRENIAGRSLIFNVLSIILNIIGVVFIVKGFHVSSGDSGTLFKSIGFGLFGLGIIGMIVLKGLHMMSFVARAFVGGLFIVSGLVKANDPWGFAFKLEEYFAEKGLFYDIYQNYDFLDGFMDWEPKTFMIWSIVICVAEIVLGAAVIVGGKIKLASWSLLFMMIGFTWLTYYTYSCVDAQELASSMGQTYERECVRDCGCFGDALRGSVGRSLSPYESFWKDIVLSYFVLIIFFAQGKIKFNSIQQNWIMIPASLLVVIFFSWVFGWYFPIVFYLLAVPLSFVAARIKLIVKMGKEWKIAIYVAKLAAIFSIYSVLYLPIKDYRAYAIGNNIIEEMNKGVPEIAEFKFVYKNKQTGEEREFETSEYQEYGDTTKWAYVDRKKTVLVEGQEAPISDFLLRVNYANLSEKELEHPILDSIVEWDFEMYYEDKVVQESTFGIDTISAYDYQPFLYDTAAYGPDTIYYQKLDEFTGLLDPLAPFDMDVTQYVLSLDNVILVTIRDMNDYNEKAIEHIKSLYIDAVDNDIPFYILSPASEEEIEAFKTKHDFNPTFLSIDGVEIKIIVRSNPGVVLLQNATVIDKWPSLSIPSFEYIQSHYLK